MDGIASNAYVLAVVDSIPDLASYALGDDSVPVKVGLFANDIIPDPAGDAGQFDAPTYTGYALQNFPPTGGGPTLAQEAGTGNWLLKLGAGNIFQPTSNTGLPETIYGWFVRWNASTSSFLIAGRFPEPIVLNSLSDYVEVEAAVRLMLGGLNGLEQANF